MPIFLDPYQIPSITILSDVFPYVKSYNIDLSTSFPVQLFNFIVSIMSCLRSTFGLTLFFERNWFSPILNLMSFYRQDY